MTIEMRAQRAGAAARAAAGEGMDPMTASTQLPAEFDRRQQRRRTRLIALAAGALLVVGAAVVIPQLADDPAPPASSAPETATAAGLTVVVPDGWSVDPEFTSPPDFVSVWNGADAGVAIHRVTRVWEPTTKAFAAAPADFGAWLRSNSTYQVRSEKPVVVAGQPTTTFTITPTTLDGNTQVPLFEIPIAGFDPADPEYPGAQGEVWDLNGGEVGYLTPVTVDGRLVIVSSALLSEAELADYDAMLSSATTS